MFRFLIIMASLLLSTAGQASAEWTKLKKIGSNRGYESALSCGLADSYTDSLKGVLICAGRYYDNTMKKFIYSGGKWGDIDPGLKSIASNPDCTGATQRTKDLRVLCAAEGEFKSSGVSDLRLLYAYSFVSGKTELSNLETAIGSAISCTGYGEIYFTGYQGFLCAWRAFDGTLHGWSGSARELSFTKSRIETAPSCAATGTASAICAAVGPNANILAFYLPSTRTPQWSRLNLGGRASSPPECSSFGFGEVLCVVRGLDLKLYVTRFNGGDFTLANWLPWGSIGGSPKGETSCADLRSEKIACAFIDINDDTLTILVYDKTWLTFRIVGPKGMGKPECAQLEPGKALCTMLGVDGNVYYTVGP